MALIQKLIFNIKLLSIWNLAQDFADGKIVKIPLAQRKAQTGPWESEGGSRIKNWLYSFFCLGTNKLQSFTIVSLDVFTQGLARKKEEVTNLLETIKENKLLGEKEKTQYIKKTTAHIKQLEKRIKYIYGQGICRNAKWILIDGQNRLFYAIIRFFFGINMITGKHDDWQYYKHTHPLQFEDNETGQIETKNNFCFKDLTSSQQADMKEIQVVLNIGTKGEAEDFINALIDINDGVPWDDFTKIIQDITKPMVGNLHDIYIFEKWPLNVALFKTLKKMTGNYSIEKHGGLKIVCELIHMLIKGVYGNVNKINENVLEYEFSTHDDKEKYFKTVMKYLDFISTGINAPHIAAGKAKDTDFSKEHLRCITQLFMILEGHRVEAYTELCGITLDGEKETFFGDSQQYAFALDQISRPTEFIEKFKAWHDSKGDYTLNSQDFEKDDEGNPINATLAGTYHWSVGQTGPQGTKAKENGLLDFIREEWSGMRNSGCIAAMKEVRGKRKMPSKVAIAVSTQFTDPYAEENLQVIGSLDYGQSEHLTSLKGKGSSDIKNMALTRVTSNQTKSSK